MTEAADLPAVSESVTVAMVTADGRPETLTWEIATEVPVQIAVNGTPFTVLLATPDHLEDLACGLLLTEQVIAHPHDIVAIDQAAYLGDLHVDVRVRDDAERDDQSRARTVLGNSACGLCGLESLAQLHARSPRGTLPSPVITDEAIRRAFVELPAHQPLNARTRSVHVAAWCEPDGQIVLAREDVGRHNALDKLVGALAVRRKLGDAGFVVMSSRCSYELVYKASYTGARVLATVSAPTTMARRWADVLGLPLACALGRGNELAVVHVDGAVTAVHPDSP